MRRIIGSFWRSLNEQVMENPVKLLERNIRNMSETYLAYTAETVQAKRGRNVEKYKDFMGKPCRYIII